MTWTAFQHQTYRLLRSLDLGPSCLLMLSGGRDSVVLLETLQALSKVLPIRLSVFHVHHGPSEKTPQQVYRDQALAFCEKLAAEKGLDFFSVRSELLLNSEDQMRQFRKQAVLKLKQAQGFAHVLYAHHQDDFVETQMLRLIRGTGVEGWREPMKVQSHFELRPLLAFSRLEIEQEARHWQLSWLEDPSNSQTDYLRNWLRQEWLPALDDKCPGALKAFSRSLSLLLQESHAEVLPPGIWAEEKLSRPLYLTLSREQQSQCLAQYIRSRGVTQYTHNQIKEIMKHLDISQVEHTFESAQLRWTLSRDSVTARPR